MITTFSDTSDEHPPTLVTVKAYVPGAKLEIVTLLVFPVIPLGLIVQFLGGKPDNTTLPVAFVQVGCVIVPINGVEGTKGCVLITIFADSTEMQPASLVTVKLYVPEIRSDKVVFEPVPEMAPGLIVQFPDGKPSRTMLPVETAHSGCVIAPATGADGVNGCEFITTLVDTNDTHPAEFVTE